MYALMRHDGMMVAIAGHERSYVRRGSEYVRQFSTKKEADKDRCSNEMIVTLKGY